MKFEIGKYYQHTSGKAIRIVKAARDRQTGMLHELEPHYSPDSWEEISQEEYLFNDHKVSSVPLPDRSRSACEKSRETVFEMD